MFDASRPLVTRDPGMAELQMQQDHACRYPASRTCIVSISMWNMLDIISGRTARRMPIRIRKENNTVSPILTGADDRRAAEGRCTFFLLASGSPVVAAAGRMAPSQ